MPDFASSARGRAARPRPLRLVFTLLVALLSAHAAAAQTADTGTVRGRVVDPNGAPIQRAKVTVTNAQTGLTRAAETDDEGLYQIAGLPLTGSYKFEATSTNFRPVTVETVELRAGQAATLDVTLQVGCVECVDVVTVFGTTDALQADSPQLGTRLDLRKIDNTPVFGRKITNLVQLNSAVRPARGTGDLFLNNFLFVTNGSGRRQTSFILDGSTDDDAWGRQTLFTNIPLSALQEFTVLTNAASAEYGRTTGSVVNIVTKSGTNDLHADLVALHRPGELQARNPLAVAGRRTIDRLAQLSGVVSGPVVRDRTHFLFGAEVNFQRRDAVITSVLAPGIFTGDFRQGLLFARLDHRLDSDNTMTARLNLDGFRDGNPADAVGGNSLPSAARVFRRKTYAAQVAETAVLGPTLVNEARFVALVGSPITQFEPVNLSTQFVRAGNGAATEGESRETTLINHQYQLADTLTWARGNHSLRLGGDATFSTSGGNGTEFGNAFTLGQFTFAANAGCTPPTSSNCVPTSQLTLAQVSRYTQSFGNANYNVREWLWSFFAQDNWRVRRDLTLNLGLRYERQTFTDDTNNFSPRVGFAYSNLFGDGHTVLRGSYGIYYSEVKANTGASFAINGPAGIFTFTATPGQTGFPTSLAPLPAFPAGVVLPPRDVTIRPGRAAFYAQFGIDTALLRGYPDKLLNPYTQQATVGLERELPGGWFFDADYVYAHTIKIDRALDLNAPSLFVPVNTAAGRTRSAAAADLTRPIRPVNGGFRRIAVVVNQGSSLYNGMQLNLNKRFARDFSVLASYTLSHTINTVEPDAPGGDRADLNLGEEGERADSLLDQRHRLVVSGWYNLPYHFVVGGVTTAASGRPYNITVGQDVNGDNANTDRPFDYATGTFVGRNTGRGTPVYDTSVFVERDFQFGERVHMGLRAEGFNVFNHPNIVARSGALGGINAATGLYNVPATFGQGIAGINGVDPGRQFQFQMRLRY
ncbi:MAG TPA: TonB-dependent receptor [Pyrinomonadaceae bacterium]|jgi:outer membrane receptor protein involved in Fe transport